MENAKEARTHQQSDSSGQTVRKEKVVTSIRGTSPARLRSRLSPREARTFSFSSDRRLKIISSRHTSRTMMTYSVTEQINQKKYL